MNNSETYTDVLVVGAGPTGLMAALLLARYNIPFRIIDKRPLSTQRGHANSIQPRTQEILQSLGLLSTLDSQGIRMPEHAFWTRDGRTGHLLRENVEQGIPSPTRFPSMLLVEQGVVEAAFENELLFRGSTVERNMELLNYVSRESAGTIRPAEAHVKNLVSGIVEIWHATYILGCDGAESTVRQIAGIAMEEQGLGHLWAIADITAETTFPDARRRAQIKSIHGSCVLTPIPPGPNSYRLLTLLTPADLQTLPPSLLSPPTAKPSAHPSPSPLSFNPHLQRSAPNYLLTLLLYRFRAALNPYTLTLLSTTWLTTYSTRLRLATAFSSPSTITNPHPCVFLLGDAAHTHSPLPSHPLNAGLLDAHNIVWKLALVHPHLARPSLLTTYNSERRTVAQTLLSFDAMSDRTVSNSLQTPVALTASYTLEEGAGIASGCGLGYNPSPLINREVRIRIRPTALAPLAPGKRLFPLRLTRHIDGNVAELADELVDSEGSAPAFHLVVFAGALMNAAVFAGLAMFLAGPESPLALHPASSSRDTTFHSPPAVYALPFTPHVRSPAAPSTPSPPLLTLHLIHTSPHMSILPSNLPPPFSLPRHQRYIYEDVGGVEGGKVGIDQRLGGMCLVRPDGVVGMVSNLDDGQGIKRWLERCLNGVWESEGGIGVGMGAGGVEGGSIVGSNPGAAGGEDDGFGFDFDGVGFDLNVEGSGTGMDFPIR